MMTHYQEIGFNVQATKIFGLGERQGSFLLKKGNYTLYANKQDFSYDSGYGDRQGYGSHPFVMMQLASGRFIGVYLNNKSPIQVEIRQNPWDSTLQVLRFKIIGGNLELYTMRGTTY